MIPPEAREQIWFHDQLVPAFSYSLMIFGYGVRLGIRRGRAHEVQRLVGVDGMYLRAII